jgi:transportin-1
LLLLLLRHPRCRQCASFTNPQSTSVDLYILVVCLRFLVELQLAGSASSYDVDMHMAALDMLAGIADGLRASVEPLVAAASPALPALVLAACGDSISDVRQSAFAFVGDLAKSCPR